jgi:hypothetical protein
MIEHRTTFTIIITNIKQISNPVYFLIVNGETKTNETKTNSLSQKSNQYEFKKLVKLFLLT